MDAKFLRHRVTEATALRILFEFLVLSECLGVVRMSDKEQLTLLCLQVYLETVYLALFCLSCFSVNEDFI